MNKKFLAKLLIFCMIFTMLPMTAFGAADNATFTNNTGGVYTIAFDSNVTEVKAGGSVDVLAKVTYSIGTDATATAVEYSLGGTTTGLTREGTTVSVPNSVETGTKFTVTASSTVGVTGDQGTISVTKEFTVTAANEISVVPDGNVADVSLPTVAVTPTDKITDPIYSLTTDTNVVFVITSGQTNITAVNVNLDKTVVKALLDTLTNAGKTNIVLRSDLGDISLPKKVLNQLNVDDAIVLKVEKTSAPTTATVNGIAPDNVKQTLVVTFTLNGEPFELAEAVTLTIANPVAAGKPPYVYYYQNSKYEKDGLTSSIDGDKLVIVAPHFSTIVVTDTEVAGGSDNNNTTSGGGGSSSNVSIATKVTGGKVTVTPTRPTRGQTVTITVTPADGYKLESLKVTDLKGNEIELTKVSDNKYTFVMPAGKVTVTPVFTKIDGSDKDDNTTNVNKRFSDVATDAWYAEYINYVAENGLMNGYEDGRFGPNDQTTRAQIVTVLYRMEGEPAVQNASSFKDVSAGGQYYSSAVAWAARNNIVNGYEDGRFAPNDNVTREQIAAILYRYAAYKEYDTTLAGNIASFSDAARVSSWATDAIAWAVGEGLMNGDNGALRPQGNATRAEIAALLMRFAENIAK